ncbi:hypothetical protein RJ55_03572 [Drechmeria coniospora]|nr:hypothetical protein RJ55_03572 [Drechmeria coniospora]
MDGEPRKESGADDVAPAQASSPEAEPKNELANEPITPDAGEVRAQINCDDEQQDQENEMGPDEPPPDRTTTSNEDIAELDEEAALDQEKSETVDKTAPGNSESEKKEVPAQLGGGEPTSVSAKYAESEIQELTTSGPGIEIEKIPMDPGMVADTSKDAEHTENLKVEEVASEISPEAKPDVGDKDAQIAPPPVEEENPAETTPVSEGQETATAEAQRAAEDDEVKDTIGSIPVKTEEKQTYRSTKDGRSREPEDSSNDKDKERHRRHRHSHHSTSHPSRNRIDEGKERRRSTHNSHDSHGSHRHRIDSTHSSADMPAPRRHDSGYSGESSGSSGRRRRTKEEQAAHERRKLERTLKDKELQRRESSNKESKDKEAEIQTERGHRSSRRHSHLRHSRPEQRQSSSTDQSPTTQPEKRFFDLRNAEGVVGRGSPAPVLGRGDADGQTPESPKEHSRPDMAKRSSTTHSKHSSTRQSTDRTSRPRSSRSGEEAGTADHKPASKKSSGSPPAEDAARRARHSERKRAKEEVKKPGGIRNLVKRLFNST